MMKNPQKGFFLPVLLIVAIAVFGIYAVIRQNPGIRNSIPESMESVELPFVESNSIVPTPFEFEEVTIPHLRNRYYEGKITSQQRLSENANYTSYFATYDSDGLFINGLLTIPKSRRPENGYPAVVFIHGYIPPNSYRTTVNYSAYVDYLAKSDLVVFKIDLRGHADSEGEAGGGYYSGDYVVDALNAYSALSNHPEVNKDSIGFWGHSMAGNVVLRAMAVKRDVPASVIWAGAGYTYSDLREFGIDDNSYRPSDADSERARKRKRLRELYGEYEPEHWFWKQVPATNYLDGVTGALQLNHAVNDNVVSFDYSRNLVKVLEGSNITTDLKEYTTGGHNISGSAFNVAMQNTVDFFKKYLK